MVAPKRYIKNLEYVNIVLFEKGVLPDVMKLSILRAAHPGLPEWDKVRQSGEGPVKMEPRLE